MKIIQSSFVRALCAIIVGALLIKYREQTMTWLTMAIGVLFLVSGLVSCAAYMAAKRRKGDVQVFDAEGRQLSGFTPSFPIVGIGSVLLGVILAVMPNTFIAWLMYILAAILVLGAIGQYVSLASVSKIARVGLGFWVMPTIILLVALLAIVHPQAIASAPLFVIGWCMLVYGVVECVNALKIWSLRRAQRVREAKAQEAQAAAGADNESGAQLLESRADADEPQA